MRKTYTSFFVILGISVICGLSDKLLAQDKRSETNICTEVSQEYRKIFQEQDQAKKYELAKAFLKRFSESECAFGHYTGGARKIVLQQIFGKCAEADKIYFTKPNADNLSNLTTSCDLYLAKSPTPDVAVSNRLALATGFGVLAEFYKDTDRSFSYAERSLQLLASTIPPKYWPPEKWAKFRTENIGRLLQYQGLFKLRQSNPDPQVAILYLTQAAEAKDSPSFKDPNTYLLRAEANANIYTKLNTEYNALPDKEKIGARGKEILSNILGIAEKLAEDYARIVVLTENTDDSAIYKDARKMLEEFYRHRDVGALIKRSKQEFGIR